MQRHPRAIAKLAPANYDVSRMADDITRKGWLPVDLARAAKVSHMAVSRFLSGERQTARMAKKLAKALGYSIDRYLPVREGASL
jgi:transcriptional regulator with XRE-family HTH domain